MARHLSDTRNSAIFYESTYMTQNLQQIINFLAPYEVLRAIKFNMPFEENSKNTT